MIEVMIAVAVIAIVMAMAITQMQPAVQQSRANAGMAEVVSAFRTAQSYAVSYRRFVQVSFPSYPGVNANQLQVTIKNSMTPNAGNDVIFATYALEGSVYYQKYTEMCIRDSRMDEPNAGSDSQRATPARREHH